MNECENHPEGPALEGKGAVGFIPLSIVLPALVSSCYVLRNYSLLLGVILRANKV